MIVEGEEKIDLESIDEDDLELNLDDADVDADVEEGLDAAMGERRESEGRGHSFDGHTIRESVKDVRRIAPRIAPTLPLRRIELRIVPDAGHFVIVIVIVIVIELRRNLSCPVVVVRTQGTQRVGDGVKKVLQGTVDMGAAVVGTTAGLMKSAASKTPGLKNIVKVFVHRCEGSEPQLNLQYLRTPLSPLLPYPTIPLRWIVCTNAFVLIFVFVCDDSGFWEAYQYVRVFIHAILRRELVQNPTTVFFTGHSLGGALATFASLDVSIHTIPRINAYLKHKEK